MSLVLRCLILAAAGIALLPMLPGADPVTDLARRVQQAGGATLAALPPATPAKLPRWRGFNLLEKFGRDWSNGPFREEDFALIHELGFSFVRLPLDYRVWTVDGDWTKFDEKVLGEIDQAVLWGARYGLHVCLNFHRAPGYTVAEPKEARSLWTDAEAQRVCALHWGTFAARYRGIPSSLLSFNLMNEPTGIDGATYATVAGKLVAAIRAADPDRLVIADGLDYGTKPCPELVPLHVAQATRGYTPFEISHFRASWIGGSEGMVVPSWPMFRGNGLLGGPGKPDLRGPLVVQGPFPEATRLRLHLATVTASSRLVVEGDGKRLFDHPIICAEGPGEWIKTTLLPEWKVWQGTFDKDYLVEIPAGTRSVTVANVEGDWLHLSELGLAPASDPAAEQKLTLTAGWEPAHPTLRREPLVDGGWRLTSPDRLDRTWLRQTTLPAWLELNRLGTGVLVGEFGTFNRTPHDVTLRWMEDALANWKDAGLGWALWNFRGSFGILDSERTDVAYEAWRGHKLDRKMLDLLRKY